MNRVGAVLGTLVGGAIGALLLANSALADLVTNGTFENGTSGWALSSTDGFTWSSTEGNPGGALVLNNSPGPVPQASQSISGLVIGNLYEISLDAKTHYNCCNSPSTPGAGVSIDGNQFDFLITNGQPWTHYQFDFTYSNVSNLLVVSAQRNGTDADGEFDNVSIQALSPSASTPEPASLALLALGLAGLGFSRRKKV